MANPGYTLDDLDKMCAESIMGWHMACAVWIDNAKGGLGTVYGHDEGCILWQPTRNIAQAWECLEKNGYRYFIRGIGREVKCYVEWYNEKNEDIQEFEAEAWAPTAPEAIVRACLKAKGVEI